LAAEYSAEEKIRIKIGCAFFAPFFAQAKKGEKVHCTYSHRCI